MMKSLIFSTILILTFAIGARAQDPVYRIINSINGLPSNTVYEVMQDSNGFIWLGHDKGVSRYDGQCFINYKSSAKQGVSISNLSYFKNTVYCQDFSGNFYHTKGDSLVFENLLPTQGQYNTAGILNGNLYISSFKNTIRVLNLETKKVAATEIPKMVTPLYCFTDNKLFVFDGKIILQFDGQNFNRLDVATIEKPFVFIIKLGNDFYGFRRDKFPYLYKIEKKGVTPIPILDQTLFIQCVDVIGDEIWISTSTGAYCFNKNFTPKFNGRCFFKGNSISKIVRDREGNYWFSTLNQGLFLVVNFDMTFYRFNNKSSTTVHADTFQNRLLAGTSNNEVLLFDEKKADFTLLYKETINHDVVNISTSKSGLFFINSDKIYVKRDKKTLASYDIAGKSEVGITEPYYALAYANGITLLSENKKFNTIPAWLKNEITQVNNGSYIHYSLLDFSTRGRWVSFDKQDSTLYAATTSGLFYFSPQSRGEIKLDNKGIFGSHMQIADGKVFCATFTEGVLIIDNKKVVDHITTQNGLSDNTVFRVLTDKKNLWILTNKGLQRYNMSSKKFTNYLTTNGLIKADIKDIALHNNEIFVATTEGVLRFPTFLDTYNSVKPLIALNSFSVNGAEVKYNDKMSLSPTENNVDIDFSVLSFKSEDAVTTKYKINNGDWIPIQSNIRLLNLPSLASGNYHILIQAFNENGIAADKPLEFIFNIKAPIYKQIWFVLLIFGAIVLAVFSYFKNRIKIINQNNTLLSEKLTLEQELQKSMLSSIKSQMNPHFLFNALNTIQSYIYTNDKENASVYLGKFSELTRLILEMSNKEYIPLSDEIKALNLYLELEKIRFEDKLTYSLSIDPNISKEIFYIPSMLIQLYVENAVKHGLLHKKDDRQLSISFIKEPTGVLVKIEDNGIGRKRSGELNRLKLRKHEPFSTEANEKRLDILNKGLKSTIALEIIDKHNEYGDAIGTIVKLHIPNLKFRD